VALSGGGIRSAAFCLGVLQALARSGWLRRVDFLSTVSGGGYIGAFLCRFFDLCGKRDGLTGAIPDLTPGAAQDRVARDMADSRSAPLAWLRRHSNYLSPTGLGELATGVAGFWRNMVSIYVVLGFLLFAAFGVLNAAAYWPVNYGDVPGVRQVLAGVAPLSSLLFTDPSPWVVAAELILWLAVLPLALAYWVVSQDLPETFLAPVLVSAAIVGGGVLIGTGSPLGVVVLALAVVWALRVWGVVRRSDGHFDPFNPARLTLARNALTRWLAVAIGVTIGLAAFALVDAAGRWLAGKMIDGGANAPNVAAWLTSMAGGVAGLVTVLRMLVRHLSGQGWLWAVGRAYIVAAVIILVGGVPPLVALAFASHLAYMLGEAFVQGAVISGVALVISLLLGVKGCVAFINRSSPLAIYASRLARAFFGALNPARRTHPDGRNVTTVVPGDDVRFDQYQPHKVGGPLHLINTAVNETIDVASQRGLRDRQAENFAVGPAGVSVAQQWHALWEQVPGGRLLTPLATAQEASPHPFLSKSGEPVAAEELSLREWVAISGGAVGPGMGRRTSLARALLFTLANVRLGYWWDSGLNAADRASVPMRCLLGRKLLVWFSTLFQSQSLLLSELSGRFPGPWERHWHLSDGGHFDTTGGYELLRRRVPFIILCDAGEDPLHLGNDFAQLVRLARVDLGAEITEVPLPKEVPVAVRPHLTTRTDLTGSPGKSSPAHATLLLVRYPPANVAGKWAGRTHSWLLYIKATLSGDEPADVTNYSALHPDFPNETTLDQVFDEPQWESYRALGEHSAGPLFT